MTTELVATIISAIVALLAAAFTFWGGMRKTHLEADLRRAELNESRQLDAQRILSRFREPLVHAAYELQSRIYNLLELDLINHHFIHGDERAQRYVVDNTAYLIGQYFGWTEIIRQEGQFLDLGEMASTRRLNEIQDALTHAWLKGSLGPHLVIFRGNQRGIGEEMIKRSKNGSECIGYAAFLKQLKKGKHPFLMHLQTDVLEAIQHIDATRGRLVVLQQNLIDLIDFLDPNHVRFSESSRLKLRK